eukprot:scaffold20699_cov66-Phaeocystis_antarctica.AAC.1
MPVQTLATVSRPLEVAPHIASSVSSRVEHATRGLRAYFDGQTPRPSVRAACAGSHRRRRTGSRRLAEGCGRCLQGEAWRVGGAINATGAENKRIRLLSRSDGARGNLPEDCRLLRGAHRTPAPTHPHVHAPAALAL